MSTDHIQEDENIEAAESQKGSINQEAVQGEPENSHNDDEIQENDTLASYKEDLEKEKDKFLRLFAEFENFKRRTAKERAELYKTAGQDVIHAMLPILDDFDRASSEIAKAKDKNLLKGVELIRSKLRETLKAKGLVEMEVKEGDVFNADQHEAITQIPAPNESLKDKVVDVVEKGYSLGDRIIRFPKVVVGK